MAIEALYSNLAKGINGIDPLSNAAVKKTDLNQPNGEIFNNLLEKSIDSLTASQERANKGIEGLVSGQATDLHTIMEQSTEAQLQLELAIQVRNKLMEGYNDIKNMQY